MSELILTKRELKAETKPIFVSSEIHEQLKQLKDETNMTIGEIAEAFIKHGINNVTVKEGI
ncbi:hypothetical protein R6Z02_16630 [Carnobacterium maltaromaticum]|uniref:hypothetical protein n=2 Tax=Bacilli TaxID=91061 RepID=UPI00026C8A81|nr:hypothetical protein [Carnobacterium maltaromaticum]MDW5525362.1 hypothetical protein [Carnobacterium maltaromaticum]TFJ58932.1 hypothetical protein CKN96_05880 [Carnobacterium maltaromaticum]